MSVLPPHHPHYDAPASPPEPRPAEPEGEREAIGPVLWGIRKFGTRWMWQAEGEFDGVLAFESADQAERWGEDHYDAGCRWEVVPLFAMRPAALRSPGPAPLGARKATRVRVYRDGVIQHAGPPVEQDAVGVLGYSVVIEWAEPVGGPAPVGERIEGVAWLDGDEFCPERPCSNHQASYLFVPNCEHDDGSDETPPTRYATLILGAPVGEDAR